MGILPQSTTFTFELFYYFLYVMSSTPHVFDSVNLKLVKCLTNPNNITFFESKCAEKSLRSGISIKNGRLMLKD